MQSEQGWRERYRVLLEAAADGIVVIDERGRIEELNPAAEAMFALEPGAAVGQNVSILMAEPHRQHHDDYLARYRATGEARIIGIGREVEGRRSDGTVFPLDLSVGEVAGPGRRHFIGILRDLTERRQAQSEVRRHRARLAHSARLSILGQMVGGLAHEIKQPLTAITNYAQAGHRLLGAGRVDQVADTLGKITAQAHRGAAVLERLRGLVRRRETRRRMQPLAPVLLAAAALTESDAAGHGQTLEVVVPDDLPALAVDEVEIQQVVLNLLHNAFEAMADAPAERADAPVRLLAAVRDGEVTVTVEDRGPGLADEAREALFSPFFTTKERGLGLGLAISRALVEEHGGRLGYEPAPGGGSRFRFVLPAPGGAP
jgi:two-component system, LuxR family, sensor kinase FixL